MEVAFALRVHVLLPLGLESAELKFWNDENK